MKKSNAATAMVSSPSAAQIAALPDAEYVACVEKSLMRAERTIMNLVASFDRNDMASIMDALSDLSIRVSMLKKPAAAMH